MSRDFIFDLMGIVAISVMTLVTLLLPAIMQAGW